MDNVDLIDAKNRLSDLIERVQAGEEIAITRHGTVVARLVPAHPEVAEQRARNAIGGLRSSRKGVRLGRLSSRDLVRAGRR